jgi:acyl dehydratase
MASPLTLDSISDLKTLVGKTIGVSDWVTVTQDRINRFADATGDHQWIHVDPERAKRESPFKQTVAHGYLTLSLTPFLLGQVLEVPESGSVINTGLEKMRLSAPVLVDSRVRLRVELKAARDMPRGGLRATFGFVVEVEGQKKPGCTADAVYVYFP